MPGLADSDAVDVQQTLRQHQAALTVLQGLIDDPDTSGVSWLDLACGKGQMISRLDQVIGASQRLKISYVGYDLDNSFARAAERKASQLGFGSEEFLVGEINCFAASLPARKFEFVTLTNTIHEVAPANLATLLFDSINSLSDAGCLFIYDMENLPKPELGAVPWSGTEMATIIVSLLRGAGVERYTPSVPRWDHAKCSGWNAQIRKEYILREVTDFEARRDRAVQSASAKIEEILAQRLSACRQALSSLTRFGSDTGREDQEELAALHEFWALNRAAGT